MPFLSGAQFSGAAICSCVGVMQKQNVRICIKETVVLETSSDKLLKTDPRHPPSATNNSHFVTELCHHVDRSLLYVGGFPDAIHEVLH